MKKLILALAISLLAAGCDAATTNTNSLLDEPITNTAVLPTATSTNIPTTTPTPTPTEKLVPVATPKPLGTPKPIPTASASNCDPNYSGCVPIASDVDCAGGSGNGPAYVSGPVNVIGYDKYDLDRDGDGIACE